MLLSLLLMQYWELKEVRHVKAPCCVAGMAAGWTVLLCALQKIHTAAVCSNHS